MITRIYADNYKCFSNFEYKPAANELLLGRNGSGKSCVFEVLRIIRWLVHQEGSVLHSPVVGPATCTRWDSRSRQRFEMDLQADGGVYSYAVELEHFPSTDETVIRHEALLFRGPEMGATEHLIERDREGARLYDDSYKPGPHVLVGFDRSVIPVVPPRRDTTKITRFRERIGRVHCLQVSPRLMEDWTIREQDAPSDDLANYADWYRHLQQEDPYVTDAARRQLTEVIDGFGALTLRRVTEEGRRLGVDVAGPGGTRWEYTLAELSDGQRALIALYTVGAYLKEYAVAQQKPTTLCIDEPENFVALSELQPWIHEIEDCADGENAQVLIASHHPEFIDHYVHTNATLFYREDGGPVRTKPFRGEGEGGLLASQIVARGWEEDE